MAILTREQILGADDIETAVVLCPEWGGEVLVKAMTGAERDVWENSLRPDSETGDRPHNVRAMALTRAIVDEKGGRIFSQEDIKALGMKSSAPISRCFAKLMDISGIGAAEVKELEEELLEDPTGTSPSDSPEISDEPDASS